MAVGVTGTFAIPWTQTAIDGVTGAPPQALDPGATWEWWGRAQRLDGPDEIARLTGAVGRAELNRRASRRAQRLPRPPRAAQALAHALPRCSTEDASLDRRSFTLTDGRQVFAATWVEGGPDIPTLVVFSGALPPSGQELWIVQVRRETTRFEDRTTRPGGVICFTPGTYISTPQGPRLVETLSEGDVINTRDDGPQPVRWRGDRVLGPAELHLRPDLRPVRVRSGALGLDRPEGDLVLSPRHRVVVEGPASRALFNTSEVLVKAGDLVWHPGIAIDATATSVRYIHLALDRHQVLLANGLGCESFHPADARTAELDPGDAARLRDRLSSHAWHGPKARRVLSQAEAAILTADTVTR